MAGYEGWSSAHRGILAGDGTRVDLVLSLADALRDILVSEQKGDREVPGIQQAYALCRALRTAFLPRGR